MDNGLTAGMTNFHEFTIAINASLSEGVFVGGGRHMAIEMPEEWTEASLTFQGSKDGVTWQNIYSDYGVEVSATVTAGTGCAMDVVALSLAPWPWLKIRSGTSASAVNQAAARTLYLITKG